MDALRRDAAALYLLAVRGLVVTALLAAIVAIAIALGSSADEKGGLLMLLFGLCAVGGFVARASRRLDMLCVDGAALGLPGNLAAMRRAQCWLLLLFLLAPSLAGLACGTGPVAFVVFAATFAAATYFAVACAILFLLSITRSLGENFGFDLLALLMSTGGLWVISVVSIGTLVRWWSRPARLAAAHVGGSAAFADASHESDPDNADLVYAAEELDADLDFMIGAAEKSGTITSVRFWLAFGHDARASWRASFVFLGVVTAVFTLAHYWKSGRGDVGLFVGACAVLAFPMLGRFSAMHERWRATGGEQSLLLLAPLWPSRRELKRTLLRVVWDGIPQVAGTLALFLMFVTLAGWIAPRVALCAFAAFICALAASLATFLSYFTRAWLTRTSFVELMILLLGIVGTGLVMFAWEIGIVPLAIGFALCLVPLATVLLVYAIRPLQFPVQQVTKRGG